MKKFLKPGRIVIILTGKYAGKKAILLKVFYEGSKDRRFGHALVAGISRYPRKVTRGMSETRASKRIRVKPFVKYVNFNHFMPTRYLLNQELDVKGMIRSFESHSTLRQAPATATPAQETADKKEAPAQKDPLSNLDFKSNLRKEIKKALEDKYSNLNLSDSSPENLLVKFFFKPLRF